MTEHAPSAVQKWLTIAVATALLLAAIAYIAIIDETSDVDLVERELPLPPVSVISVEPGLAQAQARSLAQIKPLWSAELRANTAGRVEEVTDLALAGRRVAKGDLLVRIEDTALLADLRSAEFSLAEAKVDLINAQNQTELRRRQARASPSIPVTEFSLLLPELKLAENAVGSAEARVAAAQVALENAELRAPFDGYVSERSVSPGQLVSAGDPLVSIVDGTRFELETGLSTRQWRLLQHPLGGAEVAVFNLQGEQLGTAKVREAGGFRDADTREFKVFLEISRGADAPRDVQLLSGDLVELVFPGQTFENILRVPEQSLTRDGDVWYVDPENRLVRFKPEILWQADGAVVLRPPQDQPAFRIATNPLAGFLDGMRVDPIAKDGP